MPTLSYCKSLNNCSPNLLHFKVARNEKLYFGPFVLALRFGPALHICLFILHNAHHALPCFLPTPCSAFALSAFDMSPCPALSCTQRNKNFRETRILNLCYYYMKYLNYRETLYSMYDHYSSLILFQKEAEQKSTRTIRFRVTKTPLWNSFRTVLPCHVPGPLLPCKLSNFWPKRP